jgi:hypothetical protein
MDRPTEGLDIPFESDLTLGNELGAEVDTEMLLSRGKEIESDNPTPPPPPFEEEQ